MPDIYTYPSAYCWRCSSIEGNKIAKIGARIMIIKSNDDKNWYRVASFKVLSLGNLIKLHLQHLYLKFMSHMLSKTTARLKQKGQLHSKVTVNLLKKKEKVRSTYGPWLPNVDALSRKKVFSFRFKDEELFSLTRSWTYSGWQTKIKFYRKILFSSPNSFNAQNLFGRI